MLCACVCALIYRLHVVSTGTLQRFVRSFRFIQWNQSSDWNYFWCSLDLWLRMSGQVMSWLHFIHGQFGQYHWYELLGGWTNGDLSKWVKMKRSLGRCKLYLLFVGIVWEIEFFRTNWTCGAKSKSEVKRKTEAREWWERMRILYVKNCDRLRTATASEENKIYSVALFVTFYTQQFVFQRPSECHTHTHHSFVALMKRNRGICFVSIRHFHIHFIDCSNVSAINIGRIDGDESWQRWNSCSLLFR